MRKKLSATCFLVKGLWYWRSINTWDKDGRGVVWVVTVGLRVANRVEWSANGGVTQGGGPLMGGPQCRMSILSNFFFFFFISFIYTG